MVLTSLQVCMDSSDWFQGTIHEDDAGMDSSSPSGDMLTCSRPMIERRLRPPHDQAQKCPRCDSTNTKFCYYNNYSLSQPRYFCKTCRRYWTKGGTLRNIPVGGGCRKNKKVSSKKSNDQNAHQNPGSSSNDNNPTDLHLSFPHEVQLSHLNNLLGNPNFMEGKYNMMLENHAPIDFMDNKYEALVGNVDLGSINGLGDLSNINQGMNYNVAPNFHNFCSTPFEMTMEGNSGNNIMDMTYQRLMLPYEAHHEDPNALDVKPNTKLLSLEWHDQGCADVGKDNFGYVNGVGPWPSLMNGYGSSTTNPLV